MNTQLIKTENNLWTNFKRTMYAVMVIVVAIAIPLLSYLELSYNDNTEVKQENNIKVENIAGSGAKASIAKI